MKLLLFASVDVCDDFISSWCFWYIKCDNKLYHTDLLAQSENILPSFLLQNNATGNVHFSCLIIVTYCILRHTRTTQEHFHRFTFIPNRCYFSSTELPPSKIKLPVTYYEVCKFH